MLHDLCVLLKYFYQELIYEGFLLLSYCCWACLHVTMAVTMAWLYFAALWWRSQFFINKQHYVHNNTYVLISNLIFCGCWDTMTVILLRTFWHSFKIKTDCTPPFKLELIYFIGLYRISYCTIVLKRQIIGPHKTYFRKTLITFL